MRKFGLFIVFISLLSCNSSSDSEKSQDQKLEQQVSSPDEDFAEKLRGICPTFSDSGEGLERFEMWSKDTIHQNNLMSCWIYSKGPLDEKYGVFKNLKSLDIWNADTVDGVQMFPKLNSLTIMGPGRGFVSYLDADSEWLNQLSYLRITSTIQGFNSFKNLENLGSLVIVYGMIENFPTDFHLMKALNSFRMEEAYGDQDFSKIDFSKNPNLNYVSINSGARGLPKNIEETRIKYFDYWIYDEFSADELELIRLVAEDSSYDYKNKKYK